MLRAGVANWHISKQNKNVKTAIYQYFNSTAPIARTLFCFLRFGCVKLTRFLLKFGIFPPRKDGSSAWDTSRLLQKRKHTQPTKLLLLLSSETIPQDKQKHPKTRVPPRASPGAVLRVSGAAPDARGRLAHPALAVVAGAGAVANGGAGGAAEAWRKIKHF